MIRRMGIDTVAIERIERALRRSGEGFLRRAFTPAELAYCAGRAERLAGRWAAKEAVIKCFDDTPICFRRRAIEVLPAPTGAPRVRLLGADPRGAAVQVTITHQAGLAVASAWLEMPAEGSSPLAGEVARQGRRGGLPAAVTLPARQPDAHKGTCGTVVVLAGSRGLTGAAYLGSTAAVRAGAGLVRLLVAEGIYPILAVKCTEVMATPVPEDAPGAVGGAAAEEVARQLAAARAGMVGPGIGRDPGPWRLARALAAKVRCPLVLDADALNALADDRAALTRLGPGRVLTPHPGEMARLTARPTAEIQADRAAVATAAARDWRAVVVLKGAGTLVAAPDGRLFEDRHQVPALASGGTGDVLGGLIAGLLAQGAEPFEAAVAGVHVHAEAGERLQGRLGPSGVLASELLPEIPLVMQALR